MATSFGLLTGSWTSVSVLLLLGKPGATSPVMGVLAVVAGAALLVPATSAMWSKPVAAVLMSLAAARFIVTGVYELGASGSWKTATGVIGIVLVVSAFYGSLALALEDAQHRPVLPTDRRGTGAAALSGKLDLQLETLPTEAGVRQET
jgi:succinate-acetate transporter protein